jgi:peptidoglycan/xylan/chitin deacetylase (PgdA/CDA1 family)
MMRGWGSGRLLAVATMVVLVAACAGAAPVTTSPGPTAPVAETPTPSPAPTATSTAAPTLAPTPAGSTPTVLPSEPASTAKPTPTLGPSPSPTPTPTLKPTPTPKPTPVPTATPKPTPVPTATPKPTPVPTATPKPAPTPTPPPSTLVRYGARSVKQVALTFDMGGRVGDALSIVRWLVDHDVPATIFMTGAMVDNPNTAAGRQVLAIIDANPRLLTVGNHSYSHPDFRTLTAAQMRDELRRTEVAVARYCSQSLRPFFRPPFGGYNADVLAAVGAAGYRFTVMWDVDTIDWRPIDNDPPGPTADQMVAKVLANAQNGSIVLMHLGGYETYAALPRIVDGLAAKGYDLVNLEQMLGR